LIRGYILETADEGEECDPKDWTVSCRNIANDETTVISTVTDEGTRDRFVEKEYCLDDDVGDIWTDRITIRITDT